MKVLENMMLRKIFGLKNVGKNRIVKSFLIFILKNICRMRKSKAMG